MEDIYKNYWKIKSFKKEMPSKIPIITSSGDPTVEAINMFSEQYSLYFNDLKDGAKILDIGAGGKEIEKALNIRKSKAKYISLDRAKPDGIKYDFENIDKINDSFDLIIMQEVIEHMSMEVGYHFVLKCYELLKDGAFFVVTTPNIGRPMQFFTADFTHIQHYPLGDLYGMLRTIGFSKNASIRYIEIKNSNAPLKEKLVRFSQKLFFKFLGFSFPHGILIKVQK